MRVVLRLQTNTIVSEVPVDINTSVVIGRSSQSSHKIPDELMSSTHCRITLRGSKLQITDLESKNGTYLNGLRIEKGEIFLGDEIKIGGTKMTVLSEKMDPGSVDSLTFPGPARDRQSHDLHLDFTGARMINQGTDRPGNAEKKPTTSANRELDARKKANSPIKLSKYEIKLRNKKTSSLSSTFDVILLILVVAIPLIASNFLILMAPNLFREYRLYFMLTLVLFSVSTYLIFNFKILKFTLGEKIAGIETLYNEQDSKD